MVAGMLSRGPRFCGRSRSTEAVGREMGKAVTLKGLTPRTCFQKPRIAPQRSHNFPKQQLKF